MVSLDFGSMQRFVREFDPLEHKYLRYAEVTDANKEELRQSLQKKLPPQQDGRWTLEEIEDTYQTLQKVYGAQEEEFCEIIELASEKFLGNYVDIEGIRQLFRSSYFYFEWMMHLEYSKSKHDYTYYRDHYVHQVKNMYEMFTFLDDLKYEDLCRSLYQKMNNKVAEQLRNSVWEEMHSMSAVQMGIWDAINVSGMDRERGLYGYLFHAAAIIAALLHDIGYPIAYIGRTVRELRDFLPFSFLFVQEVETIAKIQSILQDSLLYVTVGQEEVAKRIGERNHGALSAVLLLYKYYDTGKITSLSPVKKAAIELAALMIYNHTLEYRNLENEKSGHYKNIFRENPMSYLFRLCDDLQEWNRIYFDINKRSSFFICGNCYMPMTRNQEEEGRDTRERKYSCWCGEGSGRNTTTFAYRRLINIDACPRLEIDGDAATPQTIRIIYDKGCLLQTAAYNPSFALKRGEGVWEIKKMLERQPGLPETFLDFFISNNPILLKAEILGEWMETHSRSFNKLLGSYLKRIKQSDPKDQPEILSTMVGSFAGLKSDLKKLWPNVKRSLKRKLKAREGKWDVRDDNILYIWDKAFFYFYLAFLGRLLQGVDKKIWFLEDKKGAVSKDKGKPKYTLTIERLRQAVCDYFHIINKEESALVGLALYQKVRQFDEKQFRDIRSEEEWNLYFSAFQYNNYDIDLVTCYVQERTYREIKESVWDAEKSVLKRYDYYSDYYFYYTIADIMR